MVQLYNDQFNNPHHPTPKTQSPVPRAQHLALTYNNLAMQQFNPLSTPRTYSTQHPVVSNLTIHHNKSLAKSAK